MSEQKKVIVFGANGQCGLKLLKQGLNEGLRVTAFVRTPEKIPKDIREKLHKVIQGDAMDPKSVEEAIEGHDYVLSALGNVLKFGTMLLTNGSKNILEGMRSHGVKHLQVVSGAPYIPGEGGLFEAIARKVTIAARDHIRQLENLDASDDIDWVAICPYFIKDSDALDPDYKYVKQKVSGMSTATTAEIADFMIKIVQDETKAKDFRHCKMIIHH
uniref:flavin reductase (NADPH)-like n=1 Tax=Styela clava TaxID=7725 RepID=UPI00193939E1|nr:flavin reductase (NADPH)-like [Styela clava]XP_039273924.1 flavin reductase (NADPH)-like [Styela clava]